MGGNRFSCNASADDPLDLVLVLGLGHRAQRVHLSYPSYRLHGDSIAGFRRLVSSRPGARGKFSDSFDREIRQARQDRAKILANWDFESIHAC